jgi:hypothetical protein
LSHRTSFGKITSEGRRPGASGHPRLRTNVRVGRPPANGQSVWQTAPRGVADSADGPSQSRGQPRQTAPRGVVDSPGGRPLADGPSGRPLADGQPCGRAHSHPIPKQPGTLTFIYLTHSLEYKFQNCNCNPFIFIRKSGGAVEEYNAPHVT